MGHLNAVKHVSSEPAKSPIYNASCMYYLWNNLTNFLDRVCRKKCGNTTFCFHQSSIHSMQFFFLILLDVPQNIKFHKHFFRFSEKFPSNFHFFYICIKFCQHFLQNSSDCLKKKPCSFVLARPKSESELNFWTWSKSLPSALQSCFYGDFRKIL